MSGGWNARPQSGLSREEGQHWGAAGEEVGPDPFNDMDTCHEAEQKEKQVAKCAPSC